jgi:methylmalonyl-CoA/ethylmalonyl-CoA epimerase
VPPLVFHHLGIACDDIAKMRAFVHAFHQVESDTDIVVDERQGIALCLIVVAGGLRLELVSGAGVAGLIRRGITYYHVCYEVECLEGAVKALRPAGAMPVFGPIPVAIFNGRRIMYLMTPMGLIELLEKKACPR